MTDQKQDIQLIKEVLKGSQKSFTLLYNRYVRFLYLTCLRYVKNEAEDLLQDAFVKIHKDLHQFDYTKGEFSTWSKRVTINTCLQHLRKRNILKEYQEILDYSEKIKVEAKALEQLNLQDLTKKIMQLPLGYRTVFNMYVVDGYTHKEIAQNLGIATSTSKTQFMKAKNLLRTSLSKSGFPNKENYV